MKKHLFLILRILVAAAGLAYIGWKVDWIDQIEVPAGQYTLSNGQTLQLEKPTDYRVDASGINPLQPKGLLTVAIPPGSPGNPGNPGNLTVDLKKQTEFLLRPSLFTTLRYANVSLLVLGLVIIIPIYPITAFRWWMLLRIRGLMVSAWQSFRLCMVGCFFNYCMPGSTGGDVVKAYYAAKNSDRRADAVMTVIIDRVVGLLGLIFLAGIAGLFIFHDPKAHEVTLFVWTVAAVVLVGSALYFSRRIRQVSGLDWLLTKLLPKESLLAKIDQAASAYSNHKLVVLSSILLSMPVHILLALSTAMTARALDMHSPLGMLMTVVPVLFLVAAVPISFQGFGTMEYVAIKLLAYPGLATANQIVVMLVVIRLYQVVYSLSGAGFLLKGDIHIHPEREADASS